MQQLTQQGEKVAWRNSSSSSIFKGWLLSVPQTKTCWNHYRFNWVLEMHCVNFLSEKMNIVCFNNI